MCIYIPLLFYLKHAIGPANPAPHYTYAHPLARSLADTKSSIPLCTFKTTKKDLPTLDHISSPKQTQKTQRNKHPHR